MMDTPFPFAFRVALLAWYVGGACLVGGGATAVAQTVPLDAPRRPRVEIEQSEPGPAFGDPAEPASAEPAPAELVPAEPFRAEPAPAELVPAEPVPAAPAEPAAPPSDLAPNDGFEPGRGASGAAPPDAERTGPVRPTPLQPELPRGSVEPRPDAPVPFLPEIPRSLVPEPEPTAPRGLLDELDRTPTVERAGERATEGQAGMPAGERPFRRAAPHETTQPNPLTGRGAWDPFTGAGSGPLLRCDRGGVLPSWGLGGCQPPRTLYDFGSDRNFGVPIIDPVWVGVEYLGWAMKSAQLPALVTTSPLGTAPGEAGVLGGDTTILFGEETIHNRMRSGGRVRGGFWFTPDHVHGFEGAYFGVDGHDVTFYALGAGDRILARPFQDAQTGQSASLLTAYPGLLEGSILAAADMEFSGAEALYRYVLRREAYRQFDLLLGYRYGRLYDQFRTREELFSLDDASGFARDAVIERTDLFQAVNRFHGGEIGLEGRWMGSGGLTLKLLGKAALGASLSRFIVDGSTVVSEPETDAATGYTQLVVTEQHAGGLLAQPSNLGRYNTDTFAFLGELGVSLEYVWSPQVRLSFGYTLMYWSDVARALDHVDKRVNPSQLRSGDLQGAQRPEFRFSLEDFWAQGLNVGLEIDF